MSARRYVGCRVAGGVVTEERDGMARVAWDDGRTSSVRTADLRPEGGAR